MLAKYNTGTQKIQHKSKYVASINVQKSGKSRIQDFNQEITPPLSVLFWSETIADRERLKLPYLGFLGFLGTEKSGLLIALRLRKP